jgi:hypothetical protein
MRLLKVHWLGLSVLLSLGATIGLAMTQFRALYPSYAVLTGILFACWVARGIVRALGRAWRHNARTDR